MSRNGYINLHRKITDWGWYTDVNTFKLFIHLLVTANWSASEFLGYKIERGQLATSYERLAKETGLTIQQVRTAMNHLKKTGEVTYTSTQRFSLVTVCNFNVYQPPVSEEQHSNQQATNKQLTSKQQHYKKNKKNKKNKDAVEPPNYRISAPDIVVENPVPTPAYIKEKFGL